MKKIYSFYLLLFMVFFSNISYSQWQADMRLTDAPAASNTSRNNAWCIAVSGITVHVVWYDHRDGNPEIYYKRSVTGGSTWGTTDTRLTNNSAGSLYPSVSVSGTVVHVVWTDTRDGNNEIYYKRSTTAGLNWGADTKLTDNLASSMFPSVSVSGSSVHVVWTDNHHGNLEIYYKLSTDGGSSWGTVTRLTIDPASSLYPSVSASGLDVHVVWYDERNGTGNKEIYYKRSTNGGSGWGADTRLTNNTDTSNYPSVSASGSIVHVVWQDNRDGNYEIYDKRSTNGGANWGTDIRLTNNSSNSWNPSVTVSGSLVHVVWTDTRDGNRELYYKRSANGGVNWASDTRLTNNSSNSWNPSVSVSGSTVHVVWYDERNGNDEIYYKRDPSGNINGVKNINLEIPKEFSLSQNYPNPFNPKTIIIFQLPKLNIVKLCVFDILGKEVAILVDEQLQPGTYEVEFDGNELSSGIYFYMFNAGDYFSAKKMMLIK